MATVSPETDRTTTPPRGRRKGQQAHPSSNNQGAAAPLIEVRRHAAEGSMNGASIIWLVLLHVGALAAPFTFTWQGLVLLIGLHWLAGSIGICLGYHRLFTHGSFKTYRPLRWFIAGVGTLAGQGAPIDWVANHRKHHAHSDKPDDPHSPRHGKWWSHMFWLSYGLKGEAQKQHIQRWAPDMQRDKGMQVLGFLFLPLNIALGLLLLGIGYAMGGTSMGVSLLVWGLFLRLVIGLHTTWLINSATHLWGYRNYETTDDSRNTWWAAMLTYGEGWHNNHHALPRIANYGHRWWEVDPTYFVIRLLQKVGLFWDVVEYKK